jgi:capsular polysaccharide export protein
MGIEKELRPHYPNLKFKIFSLYLSGFFYSFLRRQPSSWLTQKALFQVFKHKKKYTQIIESNAVYKNLDLNKLIDYHFKLNKKASKKQLLLQAAAYIDIIDEQLQQKPDFLLLIGDLRLPVEIAKLLAQQHNIKTFFIEQGPFQTTIFDEKGVNANHSIRGFNPGENQETVSGAGKKLNSKKPKPKKYSRFPFYRGMDYFLEFSLQKTALYPPDLKMNQSLFSRFTFDKKTRENLYFPVDKNYRNPIFFLICQVPFDVNMTHHSPHYSNHFEILKDVYENLPANSTLVVREHPIYKGKYGEDFYKFIKENKIYVDFQESASPVLEKANVVIVNNSTIGLEAISKYKKTVVLGDAYYDSSGLCLKLKQKENLKILLEKALVYDINQKNVNNFMTEFTENHLLEGFITDKNLKSPKTIASGLMKLYRENS